MVIHGVLSDFRCWLNSNVSVSSESITTPQKSLSFCSKRMQGVQTIKIIIMFWRYFCKIMPSSIWKLLKNNNGNTKRIIWFSQFRLCFEMWGDIYSFFKQYIIHWKKLLDWIFLEWWFIPFQLYLFIRSLIFYIRCRCF